MAAVVLWLSAVYLLTLAYAIDVVNIVGMTAYPEEVVYKFHSVH